jgi:hypothetical protein
MNARKGIPLIGLRDGPNSGVVQGVFVDYLDVGSLGRITRVPLRVGF